MTTLGKKKLGSDLPECPYGAGCYRKHPDHFIEFAHPKKAKVAVVGLDTIDGIVKPTSSKAPPIKVASIDDSALPPCKYGGKCYRKNLLHFAEYSHPTSVKDAVDSGSDTDVVSDEDEPPKMKGVKSSDILKNGDLLSKSYTVMTEDERKELIKKAIAAKKALQEELDKTKEEVKKKDKELERLNKEVATGLLFMEGEKEALEGDKTVYFELVAERKYKEGSVDQIHFRLAESQFYRLLTGAAYKITKVEYVVNPELKKGLESCREELKKARGEDFSYPVLAFHGTQQEFITPICENGFKVPGQDKGHAHRTDTGWYGKGVYFSEYPGYCMSYIQGATKLLLCQVLPGKVFQCTKLIHGAALTKGYDSHQSPDKQELVVFNKYHILPCYVVHYAPSSTGMFQYASEKTIAAVKKAATKFKKGKVPAVTPPAAKAATKIKIGKVPAVTLPAATTGSSVDDMMAGITAKYNAAMKKKTTKSLDFLMITLTGTMMLTQKEMYDLVIQHGAKKGTKAVFNLLVASPVEYDIKTAKVQQAEKKNVDIVCEAFIYDRIVHGKKVKVDKYRYN